MIGATELASLRTNYQQSFAATATVVHKVTSEDSQGGSIDAYPTDGAVTYPCSFTRLPITPREREAQPRVQLIAQWNFQFPIDADIRSTDRLLVGSRTFEVVDAGLGSLDLARKVNCLEIT